MYAKNLCFILHRWLDDSPHLDDAMKRFETLRSHNLLPRGREKAGVRLSDEQIASAILGFVPTRPAWAGHVALIMGNLCPVGGASASFGKSETLLQAIATAISSESASRNLTQVTLTIWQNPGNDAYGARLLFEECKKRVTASYVSRYAHTLLQDGAEKAYDYEIPEATSARQLVLAQDFFRSLSEDIAISRVLDKPLKTDWKEYETEEERTSLHRRLGARSSSRFLNLAVETSVVWPEEPLRIEFGGYNFVLFPKTKENSQSISIDLQNEGLSEKEAITLANRLLSVMSWCDDHYAILGRGWSGNPVPVPVPRPDFAMVTALHWQFFRSLPVNDELLRCLAYYREGLNSRHAGLATFAVLSFYKVFEIRYATKGPVKRWVSEVFECACANITPSILEEFHADRSNSSVEDYVYQSCRVATAHAAKDWPSDADASAEIRRLSVAARILQALARHFIRIEFVFSESYHSD